MPPAENEINTKIYRFDNLHGTHKSMYICTKHLRFLPEAEFLDIIRTKVLSKSGLKMVCNVNIV